MVVLILRTRGAWLWEPGWLEIVLQALAEAEWLVVVVVEVLDSAGEAVGEGVLEVDAEGVPGVDAEEVAVVDAVVGEGVEAEEAGAEAEVVDSCSLRSELINPTGTTNKCTIHRWKYSDIQCLMTNRRLLPNDLKKIAYLLRHWQPLQDAYDVSFCIDKSPKDSMPAFLYLRGMNGSPSFFNLLKCFIDVIH